VDISSIGTILQTVSFEGTMKLIGVKAVTIKSGELKDLASPLHNLRDEEQKVLQKIIMQFYEQFLEVVQKGRKQIPQDKLQKLADGRVFTAHQAIKEGLIDRLGYPTDAVKWAKEMAKVKKAKTVIYHRPYNNMPNLYGSAMNKVGPESLSLINVELPHWLRAEGPQFLYLWAPSIE